MAQLGSGGIVGVFAQKAFAHPIMLPRKGEYIGCGFQAPETPSKERAQGARGSPSPLFRTSSGGLAAKTACVAFLSKGAVGLVLLGEERFLFLCRLQTPGSGWVPLGSRGLSTVQPSLARGALMGPARRRPSHAQSCFPTKENTLGVAFRLRRTPTKQQGPGSQRQPSPALPYGERRAGGENGLRCFPERGGLGLWFSARGEFPFAECSCQKLLLGRRCDGASALCGRGCSGSMDGAMAQKAFRSPILLPHEGGTVCSGFRAPETPSKAAGPHEPGKPNPALPYGERRPGAEMAYVFFWIRGAFGLWFDARGEFPFAECSSQKLALGRRCDGASALSVLDGSGELAGAWAQMAFVCPILLPQGEPVGSRFQPPETPSKAAGPREPGAAQPRFALWRAWCRGRKRLALLSSAKVLWG